MVIIKKRIEAISRYNPDYRSRGLKMDGQWFNAKGTEEELDKMFGPLEIGEVVEIAVDLTKHELLSVNMEEEGVEKPIASFTAKVQVPQDKLDTVIDLLKDIRKLLER